MRDLEDDLKNNAVIKELVKQIGFARDLYAAMSNMQWKHSSSPRKEEPWAVTWRYSGGIVAELRDQGESYMDFYCAGKEGQVSHFIEDIFGSMGWTPMPYKK